jgi:hypothetical protein
MRVRIREHEIALSASADDTSQWAHRPWERWPCSALSGHRFVATFDRNGLCDLTVDGRHDRGPEVMADELSAICADLLREKLPQDHPAWCIAVGQFLETEGECDG